MAQGILNWKSRPFLVGQLVETEILVNGQFHILDFSDPHFSFFRSFIPSDFSDPSALRGLLS